MEYTDSRTFSLTTPMWKSSCMADPNDIQSKEHVSQVFWEMRSGLSILIMYTPKGKLVVVEHG